MSVPNTGGVFLVPAFTGLGLPHWNSAARAMITGLSPHSDRRHIARAAFESIAFQISDALEAMRTEAAMPIKKIHGDGGPSASSFLMQLCADMRVHFAARFGDEASEEEKSLVRSGQVRSAFNSPFWPFVLATTSVGQEGLDFHTYCHAVVHWNLPSNPVDLEQREGRVHRYKGHAVRKILAATHAGSGISSAERDPWAQMFRDAVAKRPTGDTDLTPFWIFNTPAGAKIERHVPALPLSKDVSRLEALRKSLAIYRMVFGQIRQDDLLAFLLSRFPEDEIERLAQELRIDLTPPRGSSEASPILDMPA